MELSSRNFHEYSTEPSNDVDKLIGGLVCANDFAKQSQRISTPLAGFRGNINADIFTIFGLIVDYNIESVDLTALGMFPDQEPQTHDKLAYSLGSGHSCIVIRHVTDEAVVARVPSGSVVALKKYIPDPSTVGQDESLRHTQIYNAVRKEIIVQCDPLLRKNEYICDLLYIGWEQDSLLPMLAIELATFGSLENILTSSGIGPSNLQKCNITIDIALGIAALHHCMIGHGDIKPANILLHHHPERQIIAKLTDFGGVADLEDPFSKPTIGTALWSPPEVIFNDQIIDWRRVDIYAYGLIIASIWSRRELYREEPLSSACYLECFKSIQLTQEDKYNLLLMIKSDRDEAYL